MARLIYSTRAFSDLERLTDFLSESDLEAVDLIVEAISILKHHPMIGRSVDAEVRELIISRGRTGYVTLYSFEPAQDAVLILALRHQREAGYFI